jgi:hypothetical protein
MKKLPMLAPGEISDSQVRQIQFLVCCTATDLLPSEQTLVAACAAGCRRHVFYHDGYPDALPKVCMDCSEWLMNCEVC